MKKKTIKKWANRLMKYAVFGIGEEKKIKYISNKQLGRMLSSKEFKNFFSKYRGFRFEDIDFYLHSEIQYLQPVYDKTLQNYVIRTEFNIFNYTLIIDNPSREHVHLIKNRKFYLNFYEFFDNGRVIINMIEEK